MTGDMVESEIRHRRSARLLKMRSNRNELETVCKMGKIGCTACRTEVKSPRSKKVSSETIRSKQRKKKNISAVQEVQNVEAFKKLQAENKILKAENWDLKRKLIESNGLARSQKTIITRLEKLLFLQPTPIVVMERCDNTILSPPSSLGIPIKKHRTRNRNHPYELPTPKQGSHRSSHNGHLTGVDYTPEIQGKDSVLRHEKNDASLDLTMTDGNGDTGKHGVQAPHTQDDPDLDGDDDWKGRSNVEKNNGREQQKPLLQRKPTKAQHAALVNDSLKNPKPTTSVALIAEMSTGKTFDKIAIKSLRPTQSCWLP